VEEKAVFSGIIDAIGTVTKCDATPSGRRLIVRAPGYWKGALAGSSIAIDGVCLTITQVSGDDAAFDVVPETLRRSTLGGLGAGGEVNLQKSLAVGDRIDGHFVQGHVDAVGRVERAEQSETESKWWIRVDEEAMHYIIPKGSVSIDGISLTIADVADGCFSVALIPTTLERTTLGRKRAGAGVNIETDILARTVVSHLRSLQGAGGDKGAVMSLESLRRMGTA
jgi:riboflavin synthase